MGLVHESLCSRCLPLPGPILSSTIAALLVYGVASAQTSTGAFYRYVATHRASTQLVVQILSHLLGAILILALTTPINFRTRLTLSKRAISLHRLSWWNQICNQRLNFRLPWRLCFFLSAFYVISLIPGALWAGAITPLLVTAPQLSAIKVPVYNADPDSLYWNVSRDWAHATTNTTTNSFGDFSFLPVYPFGGRIMGTASEASAINATSNQTHPKYDNTRYAFTDRSYGVGSPVGIVGDVLHLPNLARYNYVEIGYRSDVTCIVNQTSLWTIHLLPNSNSGTYTFKKGNISTTFDAESAFTYPTLGWYSNIEMVGIGALSRNGRNIFSFATLGTGSSFGVQGEVTKYEMLNKVQCEVIFTPRTFNIDVEVNERLIEVTDIGQAEEYAFDPSFNASGYGNTMIAQAAINKTGLLSPIYSTFYTSVVSDGPSIANFTDTALDMQGIADTFESIFDDMLLSLSSAQLILSEVGNYSTSANATVNAVKIGQASYIYSIAAINSAIVGLFVFEALRTRGWARLRRFNYNDLTSVVVASSIGGHGICEQALGEHERWFTNEQDQVAGKTRVRLREKETVVALVSATAVEERTSSYVHGKPVFVTSTPIRGKPVSATSSEGLPLASPRNPTLDIGRESVASMNVEEYPLVSPRQSRFDDRPTLRGLMMRGIQHMEMSCDKL